MEKGLKLKKEKKHQVKTIKKKQLSKFFGANLKIFFYQKFSTN